MKSQNLETASQLFQELAANNLQIDQLRKLAYKVADGVKDPIVTISIPSDKRTTGQHRMEGFNPFEGLFPSPLGRFYGTSEPVKPDMQNHECTVSDTVVLGVLGVIISDRIEANKVIVEKLKSFGLSL